MKKIIYSVSLMIMAAGSAMLITSCGKDDSTAPIVTPNGNSTETVSLNTSYTDAGATATDDEDGAISNVSSDVSATNPNVNLTGTYTITYSALDAAGNTGYATRTVIVKNDAAYLEGTYNVTEPGTPPLSWVDTVTISTVKNNRIFFKRFGNFDNNLMYADVMVSTMDIGTQTKPSIGMAGCSHTFAQDGSNTIPIAQVGGKWNFSIKYTDQRLAGGSGCTATLPVTFEDTYRQQ